MPIFRNFGPLGDPQDIKIFGKNFGIFRAHTKRQTFVAITYQDSNFFSQHPTVGSDNQFTKHLIWTNCTEERPVRKS